MKKVLLSLSVVLGLGLGLNAQVYVSDNFESYNTGVFAVDIAGSPNAHGWAVFSSNGSSAPTSTNAGVDQVQIVDQGGKKMATTSPNSSTGSLYVWPEPLIDWSTRDAGNDYLKMSTQVTLPETLNYTGNIRWAVSYIDVNDDLGGGGGAYHYLGGYYITPADSKIYGLSTGLNSTGQIQPFLYQLNADNSDGIQYTPGSTVTLQMAYHVPTGEVVWSIPELGVQRTIINVFGQFEMALPPDEIDMELYGSAGTTGAYTMYWDNYDVTFGSTSAMATQDIRIDNSVSTVYPNPAKDQVRVKLAQNFNSAKTTATLTNMSGKLVANFANINDINVSNLPAGVYILTLTDGKLTESKKLIKK
ncbi:MAG: T9SS type A sorting domain-containing protein [Flavobacteriaceae bacterium]|nr:T9SS type A sorting domain-containing protein [Flavobacteriaceae bacterium]